MSDVHPQPTQRSEPPQGMSIPSLWLWQAVCMLVRGLHHFLALYGYFREAGRLTSHTLSLHC